MGFPLEGGRSGGNEKGQGALRRQRVGKQACEFYFPVRDLKKLDGVFPQSKNPQGGRRFKGLCEDQWDKKKLVSGGLSEVRKAGL